MADTTKNTHTQLTEFSFIYSTGFSFGSEDRLLFMHFLCKSAKYLIRWACRYGSCLWGNLNAQQWNGCVSQANRRFCKKSKVNKLLVWCVRGTCECNQFDLLKRNGKNFRFNRTINWNVYRSTMTIPTYLKRVDRRNRFQWMSVLYA